MALQNNDTTFKFDLKLNGAILPLTGYTPKIYQKATAKSPDSGAVVYQTGSGLTVVNSALGKLNWTIPHGNVTADGTQWWRLDLIDGTGAAVTAMYGPLTIKAV